MDNVDVTHTADGTVVEGNSEKKEKEPEGKLKRDVASMLERMKMTEEEINYRMKNFENVDVVKEYLKYLKCTKCGVNFLNVIKRSEKVGVHPLLGVLMCDDCCDYFGDGNFSMDSDGEDKYCRWCGEGGTIFSCSKCICGFCDKCIKKHFGKACLEKVQNDDDWVCYFCDPKPLWYLRSICSLAEQASKIKGENCKQKKLEKRKKVNKNNDIDNDTSSNSQCSLVNGLPDKKPKSKRLVKKRNRHDSFSDSSSCSGDEKENTKPKSKRKSRRLAKSEKNLKDYSTESDFEKPQKKLKMDSSSSEDGEKSGREDKNDSAGKKKNSLLEKLRGIWKLTQIVGEVGSTASKVRLKRLSFNQKFSTAGSLEKEFKKLESLVTVMSSSLNTVKTSIESVTKDLTFENVNDERDIFQSHELRLKSVARQLEEDSGDEKTARKCRESSAESHVNADGDPERANSRKRGRPAKVNDTSKNKGGGTEVKKKGNKEVNEVATESVSKSSSSSSEGDKSKKAKPKDAEKVKDSGKPLLKVKSFAKMLSDNCLKDSEIEVRGESPEKTGNEYDAETDTDKEDDKGEAKKKRKKKRKKELSESSDGSDEKLKSVKDKEKKKKGTNVSESEPKSSEKTKETTESPVCSEDEPLKKKENDKKESSKSPDLSENDSLEKKKSDEKNKEESRKSPDRSDDSAAKKKKEKDSSESSDHEVVKKRFEKMKKKMKNNFDRFKEKREKFLKNRDSDKSPDKNVIESSDSEPSTSKDTSKEKKPKRARRKHLILDSSDEEKEKKIEETEDSSSEDKNEGSSKSAGKEKKKVSDSDSDFKKISSAPTSSDEDIKVKRKRKKRGEDEPADKSSNRRKNINRILKKDSLHVETKEALKNEEERRKRVEARNKLFRELFPEDKEGSKRLILDFDPETKEPTVSVHKKLVKNLKPHQIEGVRFMWDNCFESSQRMSEDSGTGCILAHCMGLGKTLQVVTLVHTLMTHDLGVESVLIVCPLSTVSNWIQEFEMWLSKINTDPIVLYDLVKYRKIEERRFYLKDWHEGGGVLVISYDLFRTLTKDILKKREKKAKRTKSLQVFETTLLDPGPDLVICDEGHLLKNEDTALSKCMNMVKTSRRIVLTGTPLQNNLMEYHCMVQFVKPNILGTKKEFSNRFVNPINNGQFEDSTDLDVKIMKRRSHVLHSMLQGCVQRFDYSVLTPFLPEKHEYVLSIALTETQSKVYRHFVENLTAKATGLTKPTTLFNDYHNLQRIWTHPRTMKMHNEKISNTVEKEEEDSEGSLKDFVVDTDESETSSQDSDEGEVVPVPTRKRVLRSNANDPEVIKAIEEEEAAAVTKNWWDDFFKEADYDDIRASNKLVLLFSFLKRWSETNDKVLVFSQSLYSLDLIEYFLCKIDESSDESLMGYKDSWVLGADYFRLDGSTSSENRSIWCKHFNKESNTRARLFLISTRAGGLGINLFGANRVVIFDASWNPSHDLQSIFRVYRFGQKKTCYIYRFLAEATMEEKIYERQVTKLSLAHRVVDEHQIERHYSMMNQQELYKYDPIPLEERKVPMVPNDSVFADILAEHKDIIVKYHEHDSLLENREEEELTEEERKAAWKEYEEEKVRRSEVLDATAFQKQVQAAFGAGTFDMSSGMINPAFLFANQSVPTQSYINPTFINHSIPFNILQRGIQLGVTPLFNESTESYFNRVKYRERWMQVDEGPRET